PQHIRTTIISLLVLVLLSKSKKMTTRMKQQFHRATGPVPEPVDKSSAALYYQI
ncbi:unnamed protein product, partial [Amoebophrya sp. A25]